MNKPEKIAVIGSRAFTDYDLLKSTLDNYRFKLLITGGAKGADCLAEKYAEENQIETLVFKPEYNNYGRAAPHIRNRKIIDNAELVIAFWDGKSRGTRSTIKYAEKTNRQIMVIQC